MGIVPDVRQVYVPSFQLIALKLWSYRPESEFDLCDFCDLKNQGHDPETNSIPQGPMGKRYTRFQFDGCKTF